MISIVVVLAYIPLDNVKGFLSPAFSPAFVITWFLEDNHSFWKEVGFSVLICVLSLPEVLTIFSRSYWPFVLPLLRGVYSFHSPIV